MQLPLHRDQFTEAGRVVLASDAFTATAFRYPTGVEALRIDTPRGHVEVLPFMGQMLWDAAFDGLRLTIKSQFDMPRPAPTIIGTYGCLAFHSGLLRNGVPTAADSHPVHGEFPTAPMDEAGLEIDGDTLRVTGRRDHIEGFGPHNRATPSVTLQAGQTLFDLGMAVENRSFAPMELMYMAHVNFDFLPGARIVQPAPFTPYRTRVRAAVPAHVTPTPELFYVRDPATDPQGLAHLLLQRPAGDGFALSYRPAEFPKLVRWIFVNGDTEVAAFALPSTCEPEGYLAEKAKGNVRMLAPGETARFSTRLGYVDRDEAAALARNIEGAGA